MASDDEQPGRQWHGDGSTVEDSGVRRLGRRTARWDFGPPRRLAAALAGTPARWALHGGWALDAWLGAPGRSHEDVDLAVDRGAAVIVLDHLMDGGVDVAWRLPRDGGLRPRRAGEGAPPDVFRAQARQDETSVDVVLEPWDDDSWRYRRDPRVSLPLERALIETVVEGDRLRLLAPEVVLLVKTARDEAGPLPKDEADLRRVWPQLPSASRGWLREALATASPGHPWLARWSEDGVSSGSGGEDLETPLS
jgi:hypothetical protein